MSVVASKNKYEKGINLISSFLGKEENFESYYKRRYKTWNSVK